MKIVIFTSNGIRHKFFANMLSKEVDDCLVVVETKQQDNSEIEKNSSLIIKEHFNERMKTELKYFKNNDFFISKTLPVLNQEGNSSYVHQIIKKFKPDTIFVFGSSILKDKILNLVPSGNFFNMHLGLSPYYRGSGTNFWPFVNNELDYVGATILHLDPGIDTGDIVLHVRPTFKENDTVHTIGCKVIKQGTLSAIKIIKQLKKGEKIQRVKQWKISDAKYYRVNDFNENALKVYKKNIQKNIIKTFLISTKKKIKIIKPNF